MKKAGFFVLLAVAILAAPSAIAQVIALTRATVIDGSGAPPQKDVTIVMENGRIRDMGPASKITIPAGAAVVDLTGKFVAPGIINAHGHVNAKNAEAELRQYALYGVTTTVSQGTDEGDALVKTRLDQQRGNLRGARVFTTLYRFEPNSAGATPEQARAKVDEVVGQGADFIKVWIDSLYGLRAKISPEVSTAVVGEARKLGKITTAHIYEIADARMMIEAGLNILAHNVRDREVDADFIALVRKRNVSLISTLARDEGLVAYAHAPAWTEEQYFRKSVPDARMEVLRNQVRQEQLKNPQAPLINAGLKMNMINLKRMSDGGVRIAFGTDSGGAPNRFFVQGYFEHREMELMVQSGLTPMQVIQAFSKGSSEALGIDKDYGTLARGKVADLLVLEKNPLDNIANMRTIETIYLGGRKFE
jgi:imidazolonepropionase-like amidohydrolase